MTASTPRVGLLVTCLVDLFRPSIGFAAVKLLERAGCQVNVPASQTCCGQPAYNSGDRNDARAIARQVIAAFEPYDYIVAPSGSCAAMLSKHYPLLLAADPSWRERAEALAARTHELVSFLADIRGMDRVEAGYQGTITYHDGCSGLRELNIRNQPRALLRSVRGADLSELPGANVCCGFGGTFCVKYPDISNRMAEDKTADIVSSGADTVTAGDLGCLMQIAGKLQRQGLDIKARHVAEILAGQGADPAIGEPAG